MSGAWIEACGETGPLRPARTGRVASTARAADSVQLFAQLTDTLIAGKFRQGVAHGADDLEQELLRGCAFTGQSAHRSLRHPQRPALWPVAKSDRQTLPFK